MIYEKRQIFPLTVSENDLSKPKVIIEKAAPVTVISHDSKKSSTLSDAVSRRRTKRNLRRFSRSIRRRKRRPAAAIIVALSLLLCVFTVDFRLFGGRFFQTALSGGKNIIMYAVGEKEERLQNNIPAPRTIYTIPFSEEPPVQNTSESVSAEIAENEHVSEESAVAVSGALSEASVDGVKYYPITSLDLSAENIYSLSNGTGFDIDLKSFSGKTPKSLEGISVTQDPLVLILHTHGGESYSDYTGSYPENAPTRSDDNSKNVTRVGKEIAETLAGFGIASIHCDTLHDKESFINSYTESAKTVRAYLEEYPSIRFVIDVHRDAVIRDDGESVKATRNISGENYAQIMFVVGTNELGHSHPEWKENLSLAVKLQENISSSHPGLCRSINLRNVPFNQQLSSGYLLLEVGTSANTLDEALLSARVFGQELSRIILE